MIPQSLEVEREVTTRQRVETHRFWRGLVVGLLLVTPFWVMVVLVVLHVMAGAR